KLCDDCLAVGSCPACWRDSPANRIQCVGFRQGHVDPPNTGFVSEDTLIDKSVRNVGMTSVEPGAPSNTQGSGMRWGAVNYRLLLAPIVRPYSPVFPLAAIGAKSRPC